MPRAISLSGLHALAAADDQHGDAVTVPVERFS